MTTSPFDAEAYKSTTRDQWQNAAPAWHGWGPVIDMWLGEATELMLDQAQVGAGSFEGPCEMLIAIGRNPGGE